MTARLTTRESPLRYLLVGLVALALLTAACSSESEQAAGGDPPGDAPPGSSAPDKPETTLPPITWESAGPPVFIAGYFISPCEGDGPLLCIVKGDTQVGVVEIGGYPLATMHSIIDVVKGGQPSAILEAFVDDFYDAFEADRAMGCGDDYELQLAPPKQASISFGNAGVRYGFTGNFMDAATSEHVVSYAFVLRDHLVVISAAAHDDGGCVGPDEWTFTTDELAEFEPYLDLVVAALEIPEDRVLLGPADGEVPA